MSANNNRMVKIAVSKEEPDEKVGVIFMQESDDAIIVQRITPTSLFAGTHLRVGMEVLSINDVSVQGLSLGKAMRLLREAEDVVCIVAQEPSTSSGGGKNSSEIPMNEESAPVHPPPKQQEPEEETHHDYFDKPKAIPTATKELPIETFVKGMMSTALRDPEDTAEPLVSIEDSNVLEETTRNTEEGPQATPEEEKMEHYDTPGKQPDEASVKSEISTQGDVAEPVEIDEKEVISEANQASGMANVENAEKSAQESEQKTSNQKQEYAPPPPPPQQQQQQQQRATDCSEGKLKHDTDSCYDEGSSETTSPEPLVQSEEERQRDAEETNSREASNYYDDPADRSCDSRSADLLSVTSSARRGGEPPAMKAESNETEETMPSSWPVADTDDGADQESCDSLSAVQGSMISSSTTTRGGEPPAKKTQSDEAEKIPYCWQETDSDDVDKRALYYGYDDVAIVVQDLSDDGLQQPLDPGYGDDNMDGKVPAYKKTDSADDNEKPASTDAEEACRDKPHFHTDSIKIDNIDEFVDDEGDDGIHPKKIAPVDNDESNSRSSLSAPVAPIKELYEDQKPPPTVKTSDMDDEEAHPPQPADSENPNTKRAPFENGIVWNDEEGEAPGANGPGLVFFQDDHFDDSPPLQLRVTDESLPNGEISADNVHQTDLSQDFVTDAKLPSSDQKQVNANEDGAEAIDGNGTTERKEAAKESDDDDFYYDSKELPNLGYSPDFAAEEYYDYEPAADAHIVAHTHRPYAADPEEMDDEEPRYKYQEPTLIILPDEEPVRRPRSSRPDPDGYNPRDFRLENSVESEQTEQTTHWDNVRRAVDPSVAIAEVVNPRQTSSEDVKINFICYLCNRQFGHGEDRYHCRDCEDFDACAECRDLHKPRVHRMTLISGRASAVAVASTAEEEDLVVPPFGEEHDEDAVWEDVNMAAASGEHDDGEKWEDASKPLSVSDEGDGGERWQNPGQIKSSVMAEIDKGEKRPDTSNTLGDETFDDADTSVFDNTVMATATKPFPNSPVGLGIKQKPGTGLIIDHIRPDSIFDRTALRPGMKILFINDSDCSKISKEHAVALLTSSVHRVTIVAEKCRDMEELDPVVTKSSSNESRGSQKVPVFIPTSSGEPIVNIVVRKPTPDARVGLSIAQEKIGRRSLPIIVNISEDGLCTNTPLKTGMCLFCVGGVRCYGRDDSIAMLKAGHGDIPIVAGPAHVVAVTVEKPRRDTRVGIGMKKKVGVGLIVDSLAPNGLFAKTELKEGMRILLVNGVSTDLVDVTDVISIISNAEDKVTIVAEPILNSGTASEGMQSLIPLVPTSRKSTKVAATREPTSVAPSSREPSRIATRAPMESPMRIVGVTDSAPPGAPTGGEWGTGIIQPKSKKMLGLRKLMRKSDSCTLYRAPNGRVFDKNGAYVGNSTITRFTRNSVVVHGPHQPPTTY